MKMVMMMLMMVVFISAGHLPPPLMSSHLLNIREGNSTSVSPVAPPIARRCVFSTCLTANLGSSLQVGDEEAGAAASDPFGNGKK
uniref:uncharacterized protein zgc:193726 n=1 Tax=Gasterosteus aculeatus aculeatus TaxID=481459 RepID=UPI001A990CE7|nr:uncharacterized protein zgc:193726 [Gasterosteus aculeatus aculeatus]